jgi:predicted RNA-binding protein YlqC (UPF0109 family)
MTPTDMPDTPEPDEDLEPAEPGNERDDVDDIDEDDTGEGRLPGGPADDLTAFVTYMVTSLVDDPNAIEIRPERLGSNVHIKVIVPESEMGKVIGRNGRVARSMRTLLTIAASRKGVRASLDIDS